MRDGLQGSEKIRSDVLTKPWNQTFAQPCTSMHLALMEDDEVKEANKIHGGVVGEDMLVYL